MRPHAASALRSARALRTLRLRVPRAATSRSYETLEANPRFRVLPRGSGQSFFIGAAKSGIKAGNSRFARDLIVAETGFRRLRAAGIALIAADAPNSFLDDTPTSAFIRQVLAAVQELDKAMLVSRLKALGSASERPASRSTAASPMARRIGHAPLSSAPRRSRPKV